MVATRDRSNKLKEMKEFQQQAKRKIRAYDGKRIICIDNAAMNGSATDSRLAQIAYRSVFGRPADADPESSLMRELKAEGALSPDGLVYSQAALDNELLLDGLQRPIKRKDSAEQDITTQKRLTIYALDQLGVKQGEEFYLMCLVPASFTGVFRMRMENTLLSIRDVMGKKVNVLGVRSLPESFAVARGLGQDIWSMIIDGGHKTTDISVMVGGKMPKDEYQHSEQYGGAQLTEDFKPFVDEAMRKENFRPEDANLSTDEYRAIKEQALKVQPGAKIPDYEAVPEDRRVVVEVKTGTASHPLDLTEGADRVQRAFLDSLVDPVNMVLGRVAAKYQEKVAGNVLMAGGAFAPQGTGAYFRTAYNNQFGQRVEMAPIVHWPDNVHSASFGGVYHAIGMKNWVREQHKLGD